MFLSVVSNKFRHLLLAQRCLKVINMIVFDVLLDDIGFGWSQVVMILMICTYNIQGGMDGLAAVYIQHAPDSFRSAVIFCLIGDCTCFVSN